MLRPGLVAIVQCLFWAAPLLSAEPNLQAVDLTGTAREFRAYRTWNSYYWGEDATFLLEDDSGKTWRVITREITPAYEWRMGPTYPGLTVEWKRRPRVQVVGVRGVDRLPPEFHDLDLKDQPVVTAFIILAEAGPGEWKEWYVNNWFHKWGPETDRIMHKRFADRKAPYDIYGFVEGMAAPFDAKSRLIVEKHPPGRLMYHGRIRTAQDTPFGYEVELLQLIGRDPQTGGSANLYGDVNEMPKLDSRKAE